MGFFYQVTSHHEGNFLDVAALPHSLRVHHSPVKITVSINTEKSALYECSRTGFNSKEHTKSIIVVNFFSLILKCTIAVIMKLSLIFKIIDISGRCKYQKEKMGRATLLHVPSTDH